MNNPRRPAKTKNIQQKQISPFKLMLRIQFFGALVVMAVTIYLLATSTTSSQVLLSYVCGGLMLMLDLLLGFYFACKYNLKREEEWLAQTKAKIQLPVGDHYPMRSQFDAKVKEAAADFHRHNIKMYKAI